MKRISLMMSLLCLAVIHLLVLLAGFFSSYDYAAQNRDLPYCPPTTIHWVNKEAPCSGIPSFIVGLSEVENFNATKRINASPTLFTFSSGERSTPSAER